MNNFKHDLAYSLDVTRNQDFDKLYKQIWGDQIETIEYMNFETHREEQLQGIDKKIILKTGKEVKIDEKCRRVDYGDIFLEIWSNVETSKSGWLYHSVCDFIVYYIEPARKAYFLCYELLRMAWAANKKEWLVKYPIKECPNKGYKSRGIAIPTKVLLEAISEQMVKPY